MAPPPLNDHGQNVSPGDTLNLRSRHPIQWPSVVTQSSPSKLRLAPNPVG